MLTRHTARELVLQALFNVDFNIGLDVDFSTVFKNVYETFYKEKDKKGKKDNFAFDLFTGILAKKEEIDKIIEESSNDWSIKKTAVVDRNILRIGLFEMFYTDSVPAKVAINEAIELARTFGHKNSYKFIAGVLGNVYDKSGLKQKKETK